MDFRLSKLLAAGGLALLMVTAGCSGSGDPDDKVPDGGLCADKTCPTGTGCNPETGNCMNLCTLPTAPTCQAPLACQPETGKCEDLCAGVTCKSDTLACNPATGVCEGKCKDVRCGNGYACVPTTGICQKNCETNTKPTGKDECDSGFKCSQASGECVELCDEMDCRIEQWCEPDVANARGVCKGGVPTNGRPGAACETAADCDASLLGARESFECMTELNLGETVTFPDGYCFASCNGRLCPEGSVCANIGCLDACVSDAECRNGYRCEEVGLGVPVCFPSSTCDAEDPADCSPIGGDCSVDGECVDGASCIAEIVERRTAQGGTGTYEFSGFEGGYCLYRALSPSDCPAGTTSAAIGEGQFICLSDCQWGEVGACGFGETCALLSREGDAGCFIADCAVDNDCNFAECTATSKERCGKGQACVNGSCSTRDACTTNEECGDDATCEDGMCTGSFCDAALGSCLRDPDCTTVAQGLVDAFGELGLACNTTTKRFERRCNDDTNCGINAYCSDDKVCVARCSLNNEGSVCGNDEVCHPASGRCEAKCTTKDDCSNGEVCDAGGHCLARCDAPVGATTCWPNQACGADGLCGRQCTKANEVTVCGANAFCDVPSKSCKPNTCTHKPSLCGEGTVCSNDECVPRCDLETGATDCEGQVCGSDGRCAPCSTNDECGENVCNKTTGACEACTNDGACGEGGICNAGKCEAGCDENTVCEGGLVCLATGGRCEACTLDDQCAGGFVCEEGACVAGCDEETDCGSKVCSATTGRCEPCSEELACTVGTCEEGECVVEAP